MIEQVMIFALGFLFAGLAALAFAPAFWRRANRLTRRRLETQVPLSVQEILAERDQLRAEFAVEQRRVELRVAQMNLAYAADRGELGRRAVEISALKDNLAQGIQENRELEHALANLQADLSQVSAELAAMTKALYDAEGLNERKQAEFIELIKAHEAMTTLAEERLANHAAADARAVGLELRLGDVSRMLLEAEKRFTERTTQAGKLSDALALSKRNLELGESNSVALQKRLEAEAARATEISKELEALRAQRDEDQDKLRSLTQKLGVNEAVLEDASGREKKIRIQRDQEVEKARNAGRALAEKYEHLKSEYAGLQGALDVARRRCETLEADLSAKRGGRPKKPSEPDEKSAPRQEGQDIGMVVRLPRTGAEPNGAEASGEAEADEKREVRDQVGT